MLRKRHSIGVILALNLVELLMRSLLCIEFCHEFWLVQAIELVTIRQVGGAKVARVLAARWALQDLTVRLP